MAEISPEFLLKNARLSASRSGGVGGQNVNKRSTKVQLHLKIGDLPLGEEEKSRLRRKLNRHINEQDEIFVVCEEERTQAINRQKALARLKEIINAALVLPVRRIPTRPSRAAKIRRLDEKKIKSQRKQNRRRLGIEF